jgi:AraC-like DNA-binding protein
MNFKHEKKDILREIIPLTKNDCFTIFSRVKDSFDFPIHSHEEFELNFIMNAKGCQRIIGDHIEEIDDLELVLVGPNLQHAWFTHKCKSKEIKEITIQFHRDLFDEKFLNRNQLNFIKVMFEKSVRGILFSKKIVQQVASRVMELENKFGFNSMLELMSILHDISTSKNMRILSDLSFNNTELGSHNSRRVEKAFDYMNKNFDKQISLKEVSNIANMSEVGFSRFFKQRTGITFVNSLNEIRLGNASRLLIDTSNSIAEVAYHCGFNNLSNFNRIFKSKKGCTPKEFRANMAGTRIFI